jgi:ABC-type transport system involved in multi-copper enzyme maturation permease subunit
MVGPILSHELLLGSRRGWMAVIRRIYCGWLMIQLAFYYFFYAIEANLFSGSRAVDDFANGFTKVLVAQQLILAFLAAPAFAAGAITDEKLRGTLQYLLCADLTPSEIILGKLLGRITQVAFLSLCALPVICFVGVFGGVNLASLIILGVITVVPMIALGSASMLASVWSKNTRDAVLGVYIPAALGFLLAAWFRVTDWFNPAHVLEPAWGASPDWAQTLRHLAVFLMTWGAIAVGCYALAVWRLRYAYLRQLAGEGKPRKVRWWLAQRVAVPDEPIRWKERHVEGIAPLAFLRRIPRWLGMVIIFLITVTVCAGFLVQALMASTSFNQVREWAIHFDLAAMATNMTPVTNEFIWLGFWAMLLASSLVGLRCSGAITGERERQTWEALLLTPMPARELISGKLYGIIGAATPYLLAYAAPALAFSLFGGIDTVFWTALWLIVTLLAMNFFGAAGLWCSAQAKTSWRSLLWTVAMGYAAGFLLFAVAEIVAFILFIVFLLTLLLIDAYYGTNLVRTIAPSFKAFHVGVLLFLIAGFVALRIYFVRSAQRYIADRERVRHWHDESKIVPTRRRRIRVAQTVKSEPELPAKMP